MAPRPPPARAPRYARLAKQAGDAFGSIYGLQAAGRAFRTPEEMLRAMGLWELTQQEAGAHLEVQAGWRGGAARGGGWSGPGGAAWAAALHPQDTCQPTPAPGPRCHPHPRPAGEPPRHLALRRHPLRARARGRG
jgi:hypothetical protein